MIGSLIQSSQVIPADRAAWRSLAQYHYCNPRLGPIARIFALQLPDHPRLRAIPNRLAGVIVYGYCIPNSAARSQALNGLYPPEVRGRHLTRLNTDMRCLSRIVIHPLLRGWGLGPRLVQNTLPLLNVSAIECLTRLGQFHPFLQRAGMTLFPPTTPNKPNYYLWLNPDITISSALPLTRSRPIQIRSNESG